MARWCAAQVDSISAGCHTTGQGSLAAYNTPGIEQLVEHSTTTEQTVADNEACAYEEMALFNYSDVLTIFKDFSGYDPH